MKTAYKVKYTKLPSNEIINYLDFIRKTDQLIANGKGSFFEGLKKDIEKYGILNPILVYRLEFSRYEENYAIFKSRQKFKRLAFPKLEKKDRILLCANSGGSRLWVAQKNNIKIPSLILDYCHDLKDIHQCDNLTCIKSHFKSDINININFWDLNVKYVKKQ